MKKDVTWIIVAGILSGAIFKDIFLGSMFGAIASVVIGIPLFLFFNWILTLFIRSKEKVVYRIALSLSISFIVAGHWLVFHPPALLVFWTNIAYPIPPSAKNFKTRSVSIMFVSNTYLKFEIDRSDLEKVIKEKGFKRENDLERYIFRAPQHSPWFRIYDIENPEVYIIEDVDPEEEILLIYDPNTQEAFYRSSYG